MSADDFREELTRTFSSCGVFFRDTTLPEATLAKYRPGVLLREPTFLVASHWPGGFVGQHRFLIFSSEARSLDALSPERWGLCMWQLGRILKVLDCPTDGERTQVTLLDVPEHLLMFFLRPEPNPIEEAFLEHGRQLFTENRIAPPAPQLDTESWRERVAPPVGVDDEGRYFPLYRAEDYGTGSARSGIALVTCYLADVLMDAGRYSDAEDQLRFATDAMRPFAARDPLPMADLLRVSSHLRRHLGDVRGAETDLHDAFRLLKEHDEGGLPVANVLNALAQVYHQSGEHHAAERTYLHALKIAREQGSQSSDAILPMLVSLGALYQAMDRLDEAQTMLEEAVQVTNAQGLPEDLGLVNNLAWLHRATGRYDDALRGFRRALDLVRPEAHGGPLHSAILGNLAELLAASGDAEGAFSLLEGLVEGQRRTIAEVSSFASEQQLLELLRELWGRVNQCISLVLSAFAGSAVRTRWLSNLILYRKALAIDMLAYGREALLTAGAPHLRADLEELHRTREWMAQQSLAGPEGGSTPDFHDALRQAARRRDALERKLAGAVPKLDVAHLGHSADCVAVADALPPDAVAVEYLRYTPFNFDAVRTQGQSPHMPPRYLAIVFRGDRREDPELVDVGDAAAVDQLVAATRTAITGSRERPSRTLLRSTASAQGHRRAGAQLRAMVVDPLGIAPGRPRRLLLSPDGDLLRLPFAVLPGKAGPHLIDDHIVSYLTAVRDVVRLARPHRLSLEPPLVIAAPDYDAGAVTPRRHPFSPLPGTALEGQGVARMLGVRADVGVDAVKGALKQCRAPHVLHIATHGFFLPRERRLTPDQLEPGMIITDADPDRALLALDGIMATPMTFVVAEDKTFTRLSSRNLRNPLLRAGLAFAGANTWLAGGEPPERAGNGMLTAEEVTGLDLAGTELVVLSACETGLGDIQPGEGVFGLRRAFVLAGARTLVMSLWKVPDDATRDLMEDFYRTLRDGRPRAEALRDAQLRQRDRDPSPLAWAAFISEGDDGPLYGGPSVTPGGL